MIKKALTLIEIIIAISILSLMSWVTYYSVTSIIEQWIESKTKIEIEWEINSLLALIISYIEKSDYFFIVPSSFWMEKENDIKFSSLILQNKIDSDSKNLFTIIKPIKSELNEKEKPVFPNWFKYNIWIGGFNLFNDLFFDNKDNKIFYSNAWQWTIEFFNLENWTTWMLVSWLKNPSGIIAIENNIIFADNWDNTIKSFEKNAIWSINPEIIAWTSWKTWFEWNFLNWPNWISEWKWYLYIVDSGNNAIKVLDLKTKKLEILIAKKESSNDHFVDISLNSPSDIEYFSTWWKSMIILSDTNNNRIIWCSLKSPNKINKCYVIAWEKKQKSWFSWDFWLAKWAEMNRPTWISIATSKTMYISDSWNNLIRKIYAPFSNSDLLSGQNLIKTVVWNSNIKTLSFWQDWLPDTIDDVKESLSAPKWWYLATNIIFDKWSTKEVLVDNTNALLNTPTWISLIDSTPIFIDSVNWAMRIWVFDFVQEHSIIYKQKAISDEKINKYLPIEPWKIITIIRDWIRSINADNIQMSKIDDYISKDALNTMVFDIKTIDNPLIKIKLSIIDYIRYWKPITTDLETSFTLR